MWDKIAWRMFNKLLAHIKPNPLLMRINYSLFHVREAFTVIHSSSWSNTGLWFRRFHCIVFWLYSSVLTSHWSLCSSNQFNLISGQVGASAFERDQWPCQILPAQHHRDRDLHHSEHESLWTEQEDGKPPSTLHLHCTHSYSYCSYWSIFSATNCSNKRSR